jgi:Tfp pilus assembly protein PilF
MPTRKPIGETKAVPLKERLAMLRMVLLLVLLFGTLAPVTSAPILKQSQKHASYGKEADKLYNAAVDAEDRGDVELAIKLYREALAKNPKLSDGFYNLGRLYNRVGQNDRAERVLKQGLALDPTGCDINNEYGLLLMKNHKFELARRYFLKALSGAKTNAQRELVKKNIEVLDKNGTAARK